MNMKFILLIAILGISSIPLLGANDDEQYNIVRGNDSELLSYYNDAKNYRHMVFLSFDIQNLPSSEYIENVKLKLYGVAEAGGGINAATGNATPETHTIAVYNLNNYNKTWNESTFTYNDWAYKFGYSRNPETKIAEISGVAGEGWLEWDVTNDIKEIKSKGISVYSVSICDTYVVKLPTGTNENSYVRFHSKENSSGNKPYIEAIMSNSSISTNNNNRLDYTITDKVLKIDGAEKKTNLLISDISGKRVHSVQIVDDYEYTFSEKGLYIIHISNANNSFAEKIIVK